MSFYVIYDWSAKKISRLSSFVSRLFIIFAEEKKLMANSQWLKAKKYELNTEL